MLVVSALLFMRYDDFFFPSVHDGNWGVAPFETFLRVRQGVALMHLHVRIKIRK
jgi:hypothetical protein